jgi:thymidylate synthase
MEMNKSPILEIVKKKSIDNYTINDFKLSNYIGNEKIKMDMIA